MVGPFQNFARNRVETADSFNFISKKADPDKFFFTISRENFERISPDTKNTRFDFHFVSLITNIYQLTQECVPTIDLPEGNVQNRGTVGVRVAQTINCRNRSYDNHVLTRHQSGGCSQTKAVNFFINVGLFFYIKVSSGNVGFRLVVVVVRNEIFHSIFGKKLGIFGVELGCQGFVMGHHQCRQLKLLDNVGNGESFTSAGCAKEHLVVVAFVDAFNNFSNRFGLVAGRLIGGVEFELHGSILLALHNQL